MEVDCARGGVEAGGGGRRLDERGGLSGGGCRCSGEWRGAGGGGGGRRPGGGRESDAYMTRAHKRRSARRLCSACWRLQTTCFNSPSCPSGVLCPSAPLPLHYVPGCVDVQGSGVYKDRVGSDLDRLAAAGDEAKPVAWQSPAELTVPVMSTPWEQVTAVLRPGQLESEPLGLPISLSERDRLNRGGHARYLARCQPI